MKVPQRAFNWLGGQSEEMFDFGERYVRNMYSKFGFSGWLAMIDRIVWAGCSFVACRPGQMTESFVVLLCVV